MKKLSSEQRWEAAKEVASKINLSVEEIWKCSKEDIQPLFDVSEMPNQMPRYDGLDYDEDDTFEYFKKLIGFHKAAMMNPNK